MQKRCFSFSPAVKNTKGTDISFFCKTPIFSFSASIDHWVVEKKCPYSAESNVLNLLISDNPKLSVLLLLLQLRFWQKLVCIGGHVCGSLLWESITFQRWTVTRLHCCQSDWFYFSLRATDANTLLLHKQRLDIRGYKKKVQLTVKWLTWFVQNCGATVQMHLQLSGASLSAHLYLLLRLL